VQLSKNYQIDYTYRYLTKKYIIHTYINYILISLYLHVIRIIILEHSRIHTLHQQHNSNHGPYKPYYILRYLNECSVILDTLRCKIQAIRFCNALEITSSFFMYNKTLISLLKFILVYGYR